MFSLLLRLSCPSIYLSGMWDDETLCDHCMRVRWIVHDLRSSGICYVSFSSPGIVGLCAALARILRAAVVLCLTRVATRTLLWLCRAQDVSTGRDRSAVRDSMQQVAEQIAKRGDTPSTLALDDIPQASLSLGLGKQGIRSRGDLLHP